MSPLSFVDWDIRVGHAAVGVRRRHSRLSPGGWRRSETGGVLPHTGAGGAGLPWAAALEALALQLDKLGQPGGRARVVLADSMVRYAVLSKTAALVNEDEEAVYIRHRFSQLYDAGTAAWDIRVDRRHGERPRLASAVDPDLIATLEEVLREHGIRLRSVVPALADSANRHLSQLTEPAGWLLLHDAGSLGMARWEEGAWICARSLRVTPQWHSALADLLAREECLHDGQREAAVVYLDDASRATETTPAPVPGWRILLLGGAGDVEGAA
ncbi:hypothetical protein AB4Z32_18085 [Massilia sp. 2TAF26]|uniref:hypothetical protein n=1 Tax=Massilia sp. 2TAF26 TaxID=3233012 RepID=UPI003F9BFDCC